MSSLPLGSSTKNGALRARSRPGRIFEPFFNLVSSSITRGLNFTVRYQSTPDLAARGQSDGVGGLYVEAERRSELRVYSGRVTNVADFLAGVIHGLHDCEIVAGASDRYRKSEVLEILEDPKTGADFEWSFSAMGAGERGASDVRAFQKLVLTAGIKAIPSLLFASAYRVPSSSETATATQALRVPGAQDRSGLGCGPGVGPSGGVGRRLRVRRLPEVGNVTAKQRKRFYQSGEWRSMSRRIRERDGWLCTALPTANSWRGLRTSRQTIIREWIGS